MALRSRQAKSPSEYAAQMDPFKAVTALGFYLVRVHGGETASALADALQAAVQKARRIDSHETEREETK